jgi:cytochrome oxidase Cu insertion factor (SCO1/SenC/PrrC family)
MRAMRSLFAVLSLLFASIGLAQDKPVRESDFRRMLNLGPDAKIAYRDLECRPITFEQFVAAMRQPGQGSEVARAADSSAVTMSLHRRGGASCPSPYGPVTEMPAFDLADLGGQRVTSASLRGKPTLVNFYFAGCVPCILEVGPLNEFAASRKDLHFLAVTFDEPPEARAFVKRYKFKWRVVPDARDFIDRMGVVRYPMLALFDAQGRLLGTRSGGVKDELEAAAVGPAVRRWVDGLLRAQKPPS